VPGTMLTTLYELFLLNLHNAYEIIGSEMVTGSGWLLVLVVSHFVMRK
jgi:hypothetical protein